jgi:signal peptidase I
MSDQPPQQSVPKRRSRGAAAREIAQTFLLTVGIFLLVRAALQNFKVDGYSMSPTFHSGEYVLVDKFEYWFRDPQRGDVVVFHAVPAREPDSDFIKRIVGLPGDRIAIYDHAVFVNGRRLPEPYIHDPPAYTFSPVTVPPNEYFVLGDNRNNSFDSSRWTATPFLARKYIIGKALVAYWPWKDFTLFQDPNYR